MGAMFTKLMILVAVAMLAVCPGWAQISEDRIPPAGVKPARALPFKAGEVLTYDVTFSKLIFSGSIGELKLSVSRPAEANSPTLEFKAEAISKGFFPSLFGIKVRDGYSSRVNESDLGLSTSVKLIEEGKVRREQKTTIDREAQRVTYTDRDLAKEKAQPT